MQDLDTTPEAQAVRLRWLRSLSGAERVEIAAQMSDDAREITSCGIRHHHPDWPEERVRLELLRRIYGDEIARAVEGRLR